MIPRLKCKSCVVDISAGNEHCMGLCPLHIGLLWLSVTVSVARRHLFCGEKDLCLSVGVRIHIQNAVKNYTILEKCWL